MTQLQEILGQAETVAIGGHVRPDGDCVGSCLGLYQYLKDNYPQVKTDVYLEEFRDVFYFLSGAEDVKHNVEQEKVYDLFLVLDCGDEDRLGFSDVLYKKARRTACIDHHISNNAFADYNYVVPEASSTSELVYSLLNPEHISEKTAESLYLGIVHDTGVFQYSSTSPETMEAAAQLMRKGIDAQRIIDKTFYEKTYMQNQILGKALLESMLFMGGKCIAAALTMKEMAFYGVTAKDVEGIVSQLRVTRGVEVAVFMYEIEPHTFKVSLRSSEKVDVSRIAQFFGGGGHKKAAGFSMKSTVHDILTNLSAQIEKQLEQEQEK